MYDIKPLEEEWKKYKKKKRRPWFVFLFSIFFILLISFTFLNYKEIDFLKFYDNSRLEIVTNKSTTLLIDKALTTLEIKKPAVSEVPQTSEMKSISSISYENGSIEITEELPISNDVDTVKEPRKKVHLNIIETASVSAYEDVAKRFKQSHDTDDSLFLAKSYYSQGDYRKAEYWALQTNKVNENIEESWLIFIKSKVKLGHKNEAIRILTAYIKKSNSAQAKSLLYKIKKGTL
jgi:tetratricopeptide (TPR) repeat protein